MKTVIWIIWKLACGKDTAWEYISNKLNIQLNVISDGLKRIARERWIEVKRENLIAISREITPIHWDGYLAEIILKNSLDNPTLIVWMRQLGQIEYLKENSRFILIAMDWNDEIRYDRMKQRWKLGDAKDLEDFIRIEKEEEKSVQKTSLCMEHANYKVHNNWGLEDLYTQLDEILKKEWLI